jgi:FkbM family methyltransferase
MTRELRRAHQRFLGSHYIVDIFTYRLMRLFPQVAERSQERTLNVRGGGSISYRRNRGDIQGIREVFLDESYRLPSGIEPRVVVDLGANIGLTTVWLNRQFNIEKCVAVEPVPGNVRLLRKNLEDNRIHCEVIESAVASFQGTATFLAPVDSNLGRLGDSGDISVTTVTMDEIVESLGCRVNLLKLDIEGGEQDLLTHGDLKWLSRVDVIIAEFHPDVVDYPGLTRVLEDHGFIYHRAGNLWPNSMDIFVSHALAPHGAPQTS